MWLVTTNGFVSLVQNNQDASMIEIRARVPQDITNNFPDAEVFVIDGADYRYRASMPRTAVARAFAEQILNDLTYTSHFKDVALAKDQDQTNAARRKAYYAMWNNLAEMQDYRPYSRVPRSQERTAMPPRYGATYGRYAPPFTSHQERQGGTAATADWWEQDTAADTPGWDAYIADLSDEELAELTADDFFTDEELNAVEAAYGVDVETLTDAEIDAYLADLDTLKLRPSRKE